LLDGAIGKFVPLETSEAMESNKKEQVRVLAGNQFSEWKVIREDNVPNCFRLRSIPKTDTTTSPSDQCVVVTWTRQSKEKKYP
jgi:hypothetical protein